MTYDAGVARARYELGTEQFDAAIQRAKRGYAELQAAQEQALRPVNLPAVGGGGAGTPAASRAASFAQEQRAVASLEAQQARLARTQGDAARAAELEAQAQQRLTAAMVRTDTTSAQAIAIQKQLTSVQQQAARGAQAGGAGALDQIKSGLAGIVGPAAAAGAALAAVNAVVRDTTEGFRLRAQIDQTQRSIALQVAGLRDSAAVFERAGAFAHRYALTQEETNNALRASTAILRQSRASTEDVLGTLLRLQQLSPEQGIEGAALALKELQGGSTRSLVERFEVSVSQAAKLREEIRGGADAVQVLSRFLAESGVGMEALATRTQGAAGKLNELRQQEESARLAAGGASGGIGLFLINEQITLTRGWTRLLGGEGGLSEAIRQTGLDADGAGARNRAYAAALLAGKTGTEAAAIGEQAYAEATGQASQVTTQAAQATEVLGLTQEQAALNTRLLAGEQAHLRDEHLQTGQIVQQTSAQVQEFNATLAASAAQAQISAAQSTILKQRQEDVAHSALLASQGMLGEGDQALLLARKLGIAHDQAQLLINANQIIAGQAAFAAQRAGEQGRLPDDELRSRNRARDAADKLHQQFVEQEQQKQKQIADAQRTLELARARTPAQRIAVYQRELAATTDVAERLRIQAQIEQEKASTARAHTTELGKQLNLEEKIRDSKEAQLKASIDARKLGAQDTLDRLKEDQQLEQARRVLATSHDERFRQAAQARIDLIGAERDSRALAIREAQATAGGAIVGGRVFQGIPGGGGAPPALAPTPPLPGAQPAGAQAPAATGTPPSGIQVLVFIDGDQVAAKVETRVVSDLRGSHQQSVSASGGVR